MKFLLDTSHDLSVCADELGVGIEDVGQLITPLNGFKNRGCKFAIDNGAYSSFNGDRFLARLEREESNRDNCLFVVCPDVVGSAIRTLEVFHHWYPRLHRWPIALACQNGQENLEIPWRLIHAVFIGGDNEFKMSEGAKQIVKAAQILGKWTHVGRVNTPLRFAEIDSWGVDSVDGSGISLYSHMRHAVRGVLQPNARSKQMVLA